MSMGRMPCAFNSRIRDAFIEAGRLLVDAGGLGDTLRLRLASKLRLMLGEYTPAATTSKPVQGVAQGVAGTFSILAK
jgi:hypothetical protein